MVLSQGDDEGEHHPLAFFSRKLLSHEECYSVNENECLAIKLEFMPFMCIA